MFQFIHCHEGCVLIITEASPGPLIPAIPKAMGSQGRFCGNRGTCFSSPSLITHKSPARTAQCAIIFLNRASSSLALGMAKSMDLSSLFTHASNGQSQIFLYPVHLAEIALYRVCKFNLSYPTIARSKVPKCTMNHAMYRNPKLESQFIFSIKALKRHSSSPVLLQPPHGLLHFSHH